MGRIFDADDRADDSIEGLKMFCEEHLKPDMVMVEIGCFRGVSTELFAHHVKTVHAVDPWTLENPDYDALPYPMIKEAERRFDQMCLGHPNIIKHKGFSVEMAKRFNPESLDLIYVDGDHRPQAVQADFDAWIPKVKPGGIIAGHDYSLVHEVIHRPVKVYPDLTWRYFKQ